LKFLRQCSDSCATRNAGRSPAVANRGPIDVFLFIQCVMLRGLQQHMCHGVASKVEGLALNHKPRVSQFRETKMVSQEPYCNNA